MPWRQAIEIGVVDECLGDAIEKRAIPFRVSISQSQKIRNEDAGIAEYQNGPTAAKLALIAHVSAR